MGLMTGLLVVPEIINNFKKAKNVAKNFGNALANFNEESQKKETAQSSDSNVPVYSQKDLEGQKRDFLKNQQVANREKQKMNNFIVKKNVAQFNKDMKQGKIMNQLFPYSQRKEPIGIKSPMIPKPGENFKINKTSPTGSKTGLTLRMRKPRMTKQQKINKKIGQGLSNPVNYDNKIKKIMGVD